ncbi:dihydrofolate reductase [Arthrobacter jiangjiafuii]|uniref:dihydrofolate reductase n=1 Tax=Arthrobacter jiangjiafuii TaxID=2817475 RepID=A0A975M427_9MICC|nr:dihydrofolate reductase [Arthrobacter jiangjiafuii]MBP3042760.1 dihydrofolate reductase [Arthrobacter jiangjiafuii]QWC09525.1 dihydrofolate reductase [Arthrobacter jiangjiafuii]
MTTPGSIRYYPVTGTDDAGDGRDLEAALAAGSPNGVPQPLVGMIWAQTVDGVIGRDGGMPWHLPEDLAHFKNTTAGHPVIMGRRTWESFPAAYRPLPGRTNIVVSSSDTLAAELEPAGAVVVPSLEQALDTARRSPGAEQVWIVGGAQLYEAAAPLADAAVVTVIGTSIAGDTYAPRLGPEWTFAAVSPAEGWHTAANGTEYRIALWARTGETDSRVTNQDGHGVLP